MYNVITAILQFQLGVTTMSVISNIHTAQVYDAKTSKPLSGQRGVVTIAKKDKAGNYGQYLQQTQFTSIPVLTTYDVNNARLTPHIVEFLQGVQNQIIGDALKCGIKSFSDSELDESAICAYLEQSSTGDKWDAERVSNWFEVTVAPYVAEVLMAKGLDDTALAEKLAAMTETFGETLGSRAKISLNKAVALEKLLKLIPHETLVKDAIALRFVARLDKIINPVDETIDALGF